MPGRRFLVVVDRGAFRNQRPDKHRTAILLGRVGDAYNRATRVV